MQDKKEMSALHSENLEMYFTEYLNDLTTVVNNIKETMYGVININMSPAKNNTREFDPSFFDINQPKKVFDDLKKV